MQGKGLTTRQGEKNPINLLAAHLLNLSKHYFWEGFPCGFCMPDGSEALHTVEAVGKEAAEGVWFLMSGSGSREVWWVQQVIH